MSFSDSELELLACLHRKKVIGKKHRRVDSIAGLCHIMTKKGLKRMLRNLARRGVLYEWHGPAYSLTHEGVRVAEEHMGIR